jgi:hypothetical protein
VKEIDMTEKSPEIYAFVTYAWVLALASLGGMVAYFKKLKGGKKWRVTDLLIEIATSAFVGVTTFYLCEAAGLSQVFTAAIVGISGHYSSRALVLFGKVMDKTLGKFGA